MRYLLPPTSKTTLLPATKSAELNVVFSSLKLLQLALDAVAYHSVIAASAVALGDPAGNAFQKLTSADLAMTFTLVAIRHVPSLETIVKFPIWESA